jgi:hypothetical protein
VSIVSTPQSPGSFDQTQTVVPEHIIEVQSPTDEDTYNVGTNTLITSSQKRFYTSEQCEEARVALEQMVHNPSYNTDSSYFRDNALNFVDRHLHYLSTHPAANLAGYLSNLKLMTKVKK